MSPMKNNAAPSAPRSALARISINTICMYGAWAVRKLSTLLLAVVIGRTAGVSDFGVYCLALVWMEAAIRLAEFGTDIIIIRETSARVTRAAELAGNALSWRLAASVTLYPAMVFASRAVSHNTLLPDVIAIMGIGMVAQAMGNFYLALVQGRERVDLHAFAQAASSLFGLVLGILAIVEGRGLYGLAQAYSARGLFSLLLGMGFCRRLGIRTGPRIDLRFMAAMLRNSAPIGINRFMTILYLGSGMTLLQFFHGETAVGLFAAAMKVFEACSAFGTLTMVAAFPTIARLHAVSREGLRRTVAAIVRLFCWAGIPLSILVALGSRMILSFFGSGFPVAAPSLVILMIAIPFSLNSELAERLAYAHQDQKKVLLIRFVGISVNMLVLFPTVLHFSALAPALAILAAEVVMLALFIPLWHGIMPRLPSSVLPGYFIGPQSAPAHNATRSQSAVSLVRRFAYHYLLIEKRCKERLLLALHWIVAVICIVTGLCRLSRRFYLRKRMLVLAYHRVADGEDPLQLNVSPGLFRKEMQFLQRHFNCIDLDRVADALSGSCTFPDRGIAVTFDDGYRGDLPALKRSLVEHPVPVTIFVAPAFQENPSLAWWETLAGIIGEAGRRGSMIAAGTDGPPVRLQTPFARRICTRTIAEHIRHRAPDSRDEYLLHLAESLGIDLKDCVDPHCFLNWHELDDLAKNLPVTVGSHTQTHYPVMAEANDSFRDELRKSKNAIAARLNSKVRHFAYPSGSVMQTDSVKAGLLRSEGFDTAATNIAGITDRRSNRYALKRIGISNEPFPVFAAKVSGVFEMLKMLRSAIGRR